jgi:hypothetical protein
MNTRASSNGKSDAAASAAAGLPNPPRTIADIPGLGPIRVRALEKAGWSNLSVLRSADLEALLAVPGLTEIKARHIQQYLARFMPEDLIAIPANVETANTDKAASQNAASSGSTPGAAQLVERATRAMGEVITVLLGPEAPQFRSRLLRILGQFAQCAESLATDAVHLSEEQQARAIRRLRRAAKALSEFTGSATSDRKAQGRLADALEELNSKLAECRLS